MSFFTKAGAITSITISRPFYPKKTFREKLQNRESEEQECQKKLKIKCKELETKLDLEKTTKGRMESHISRQTDVIESLTTDLEELGAREKNGQEEQKKLAKNIR